MKKANTKKPASAKREQAAPAPVVNEGNNGIRIQDVRVHEAPANEFSHSHIRAIAEALGENARALAKLADAVKPAGVYVAGCHIDARKQ